MNTRAGLEVGVLQLDLGRGVTADDTETFGESSDGNDSWTTIGVSCDVVEASWMALVDSFEYKLIKDIEKKYQKFI